MQIQTNTGDIVELTIGEPTEFTATQPFQLPAPPGGLPPNITSGMVMTFDGQHFGYGGNPPRPLPQFIGAIKAGWAVPTSAYHGQVFVRRPANIQVRAAEGGNPMDVKRSSVITTAQAEEQSVGSIAEHAAHVKKTNTRRVMAADQEGVAVRRLTTPADYRKQRTEVTPSSIHDQIRAAESVQIQPGVGRSRDDILAAMTEEQRESYLQSLNAHRGAYIDLGPISAPDTQGNVVASLKKTSKVQTSEGIQTQLYVGGGTETVDLSGLGSGQPAEVTTVVVDGIKLSNTNGPKKGQAVKGAKSTKTETLSWDPRRVIAKTICQDFPDNYDFEATVRKKIARIQADFEDRVDILRAVYAAENDEMKARLLEEFPEAFTA